MVFKFSCTILDMDRDVAQMVERSLAQQAPSGDLALLMLDGFNFLSFFPNKSESGSEKDNGLGLRKYLACSMALVHFL